MREHYIEVFRVKITDSYHTSIFSFPNDILFGLIYLSVSETSVATNQSKCVDWSHCFHQHQTFILSYIQNRIVDETEACLEERNENPIFYPSAHPHKSSFGRA